MYGGNLSLLAAPVDTSEKAEVCVPFVIADGLDISVPLFLKLVGGSQCFANAYTSTHIHTM